VRWRHELVNVLNNFLIRTIKRQLDFLTVLAHRS